MPRHKQITTCRKSGGPVSNMCSCEHCCLAVCEVCGAAEGTLTTDCPGSKVAFDRQQEVFETNFDYTDDRGWHMAATIRAGASIPLRSPRFESTEVSPEPLRSDPRAVVAPSINWAAVDHVASLQHDLSQKAIAWALADRAAEDQSAACTRIEDEIDALLPKGHEVCRARTAPLRFEQPNEHMQELLKTLEYETIGFRLANQRAEKCDDEFRQAARKLVTALEEGQIAAVSNDKMLFTRTCGCTVIAGAACPHNVAAPPLREPR